MLILQPTSPRQFAEHTVKVINTILRAIVADAQVNELIDNNMLKEASKLSGHANNEWARAEKLLIDIRRIVPPDEIN